MSNGTHGPMPLLAVTAAHTRLIRGSIWVFERELDLVAQIAELE